MNRFEALENSETVDLFDDEPVVTHGQPIFTAPGPEGVEQPTDDRRSYIGGSDAAVVCGLSPWKTPYQLWQEKRGQVEAPDLSENERVYWGTVLEDVVAAEYQKRTGTRVRRVNRLMRHPQHPWMAAHIDRDVVGESRILECKTTDGSKAAEWADGEVPIYYQPQVQHYLAVTGADACDVAVLIGGNRFAVLSVERDAEFIEALIELESAFWKRVQAGEPPEPASSEEASLRWRRADPGEVMAGAEDFETAGRLLKIRQSIARLEAKRDELETALKTALADRGDLLIYRGQKLCSWKSQVRRRFDQKVFEAEHPDLAETYKTENELRVFRLLVKE